MYKKITQFDTNQSLNFHFFDLESYALTTWLSLTHT